MRRASSVLDRTPSLRKMLRRWNSTVLALTKSARDLAVRESLADELGDAPLRRGDALRSRTAAADPLELVPGALGPEPRADAFECRKRFLERLACRACAAGGAPRHRAPSRCPARSSGSATSAPRSIGSARRAPAASASPPTRCEQAAATRTTRADCRSRRCAQPSYQPSSSPADSRSPMPINASTSSVTNRMARLADRRRRACVRQAARAGGAPPERRQRGSSIPRGRTHEAIGPAGSARPRDLEGARCPPNGRALVASIRLDRRHHAEHHGLVLGPLRLGREVVCAFGVA